LVHLAARSDAPFGLIDLRHTDVFFRACSSTGLNSLWLTGLNSLWLKCGGSVQRSADDVIVNHPDCLSSR
jgi:hypothetical protein